MPNVTVQKIEEKKPALAPVLQGIEETFDKIRNRAFELFERRGRVPGFELDDWLQAEHDLFWVPPAELTESGSEFKVKVGVPGYEAKDLDVTVQPDEILIQGKAEQSEEKTEKGVYYSEFGAKSLYRRFALAAPIEVGAVTANVDKGMLTVIAPKKKEAATKVPIAA